MRIISGIHGGRRINPPAKMPYTRPTTDIAKEGLFNVIQNNLDIESLAVLDLFGGTGCISYELASRGAEDITIVEKDSSMYDFIKKTALELKFSNFLVVKSDVFKFIDSSTKQYDLMYSQVFLPSIISPPITLPTLFDVPKASK